MTTRTAAWIGGAGILLCVVAQAANALLMRTTPQGWDYGFLLLLCFPIVGALIISRQPRNTIGWLLFGAGTSICLGGVCAAVVYATLGSTPALWQQLLAMLTNILFVGAFEGLMIAMAFLFPTGRPLSARWRIAFFAVGLCLASIFVLASLRPGPLGLFFEDTPRLTNPVGIGWVDSFVNGIDFLFVPLGFVVVGASLAAVVTRVRRARGIERLQLQWIALALVLVGVPTIVSAVAQGFDSELARWAAAISEQVFFLSATVGIAAAIGIAILRYQLYDIERLVNRAIVYLSLSACLALGYAGMVVLLQVLLEPLTHGSDLTVAGATLAAAAAVRPLHRRIQGTVDRRFYRRRYDAERTIAAFSGRLREEIDLDNLMYDLQRVVHQTMQPTSVTIWVRPARASGSE